MPTRRLDDRSGRLVLACSPGAPAGAGAAAALSGSVVDTVTFLLDPLAGRLVPSDEKPGAEAGGWTFLLGASRGDLLLAAASDVSVVGPATDGEALQRRVVDAALEAQRAQRRRSRRAHQREAFLLLVEGLLRAEEPEEVFGALLSRTAAIVGGHQMLLARRSADAGEGSDLEWRSVPPLAAPPAPLAGRLASRLSVSGVATAAEVRRPGSAWADLAPLLASTGAAAVAWVGLGPHGVLFLAERRADRQFDPDDWHLLHLAARLADVTLTSLAGSARSG
jgi:hypothetical protein